MNPIPLNNENQIGRIILSQSQPENFPAHARGFQPFRYDEPSLAPGVTRALAVLGFTDVIYCAIQKITKGVGSEKHSHAAQDGCWMVISGAAIFEDEHGKKHILKEMDGIVIPRGTPYAFHQTGDEPCLLLQFEAMNAKANKNTFTVYADKSKEDHVAHALSETQLYDARTGGL